MDAAFAFDSGELWRPSIFAQALEDDDSNIFAQLQTGLKSSLFESLDVGSFLETDALAFPSLEDDSSDHTSQAGAEPLDEISFEDLKDSKEIYTEAEDPWDFDVLGLEPSRDEHGLHSWEAFQLRKQADQVPVYLSEAGTKGFDAYLQRFNKSEGVFPQDVMLRASCTLVLGRSSLFFQWDQPSKSFRQTVRDALISGTSRECSESLLSRFMHMGALFRELNDFSSIVGKVECTTIVALRRCIATVLVGIEYHVSNQTPGLRSLLQLQRIVERPTEILSQLDELVKLLGRSCSDETVIGILSDHVTAIAENGSNLCALFHAVLLQVCTPWLQRIAEDVGLCRSIDTDIPHADFQGGTSETYSVLTPDDTSLVRTTKSGFQLLRQHMPSHPLALPQLVTLDLQRCDIDATQALDSSLWSNAGNESEAKAGTLVMCMGSQAAAGDRSQEEQSQQAFMLSDDLLEEMIELSGIETTTLDSTITSANDIQITLSAILSDNDLKNNSSITFKYSGTLDVLATLRPAIQAHARLINHAVLSYIFDTYKLREHLQLHRAFHLFGDGNFVTRLSTALFSDDVQTAERRRGTVPTAQIMGLRLGSRQEQRWPPASSELRLTLMGVLNDTYLSTQADSTPAELPGGLSFAIRELSDEEIDKVMDTTSIHALDFLRLQYTPPEPLATVFTPDVVNNYDSIFRTLLVLVRMLHATSQLTVQCRMRKSSTASSHADTLSRFAWQARHVVTVLTSHYADVAIGGAWSRFSKSLDEIDPTHTSQLHHSRSKKAARYASVDDVTLLHDTCIEDIRAKMFLRRKHEKIRQSIEAVYDAILKGAAAVLRQPDTQPDLRQHVRAFDKHFAELVRLLNGIAQKPAKENRTAVASETESEVAEILVARLEWLRPEE